jgi:hypothetical protein
MKCRFLCAKKQGLFPISRFQIYRRSHVGYSSAGGSDLFLLIISRNCIDYFTVPDSVFRTEPGTVPAPAICGFDRFICTDETPGMHAKKFLLPFVCLKET